MNKIVLALFALCAFVGLSSAAATESKQYTSRFDNVDVDKILKNDRLLNGYFKCLMDEGNCSPDGNELKKHLPDALANKCAKCTAKQKEGSEKIIRYLIDNKAEMWKRLEAKYDPKGSYRTAYKSEADKRGIKV